VIIADSRPQLEGKELTRNLVKYGVKCTYILINALPYVIQEVLVALKRRGGENARSNPFIGLQGDPGSGSNFRQRRGVVACRLRGGGDDGSKAQHPTAGVLRDLQDARASAVGLHLLQRAG